MRPIKSELVSILMPTYNVEKFVGSAIDSVINQTYKHWELIIIDDGSSDNTFRCIESYQARDGRIKYKRLERNMGIVHALNVGLSMATGAYIARIDGDDLMLPQKIEIQLNFFRDNIDYSIVGTFIKKINEHGAVIGDENFPIDHADIIKASKYVNPVLHIWMAKSSVYDVNEGYRQTAPCEDYDFLLRSISKGFKVYNIPMHLSLIRYREGNTMHHSSLRQKKAFNFIRKSFASRVIDEPNFLTNFLFSVKERNFYDVLHEYSVYFLIMGRSSESTFTKYCFYALALVSPYTMQELLRRMIFKMKWGC